MSVGSGHGTYEAVGAAIRKEANGYIKYITDEIRAAIGEETDDFKASCLNVQRSVRLIEENLDIRAMEERGLKVLGAVYHIEDGHVDFL